MQHSGAVCPRVLKAAVCQTVSLWHGCQVGLSSRSFHQFTVTDRNGKFRLPRVSSGTYYLRFRYAGFNDLLLPVDVERSGSFGPLRVRLEISN